MSVNGSITKIASNRNLVNQDNATTSWIRNPLWITMPDISASGAQRVLGLYRIDNNQHNYVALNAQTNAGPYIVDWGDGIVESFTSLTSAYHQYSYSGIVDTSTSNSSNAASLGYKQAIISVTPSGSNNLQSFLQNVRHTGLSSNINPVTSKWLEFVINGPNISNLSIGGTAVQPLYLENIYVHNLQIAGTNTTQMFRYCRGLKNINWFDTSQWTTFASMFEFCTSLESVPFYDTSNGTSLAGMFNSCYALKNVPLFNSSKVTSMNAMFQGCYNLRSIPLFDTSNVTTMAYMLNQCWRLNSIPKFNTSKVTNMTQFACNTPISSFPLLDTSNVTNFYQMFFQCFQLKSIPPLDMSKASNTSDFSYWAGYASNLSTINLNLSAITSGNFLGAFIGTNNLRNINLTNASGIANATSMFQYCVNLESVSGLDTKNTTNFTSMFAGCNSLKNVGSLVISSGANLGYNATYGTTSNMFNGCYNLENINLSGTSSSIHLGRMSLSSTTLNSIYSGLATVSPSGTATIVVTDNYGATSSTTSIATNKGWTVVT